ncbi:MscL family protein [bacterium]|nr:MscL family protein [bacterium]
MTVGPGNFSFAIMVIKFLNPVLICHFLFSINPCRGYSHNPIGKFPGGKKFMDFFLNLHSQPYEILKSTQEAGAATINYGLFLYSLVNLVTIAAAIFIMVKIANSFQKNKNLRLSLNHQMKNNFSVKSGIY